TRRSAEQRPSGGERVQRMPTAINHTLHVTARLMCALPWPMISLRPMSSPDGLRLLRPVQNAQPTEPLQSALPVQIC
ncbi:MAG: hypothetical protein RIK87_27275, partial [Fuerstiella sp.]